MPLTKLIVITRLTYCAVLFVLVATTFVPLAIGEFREMKMQPALERALRHKDILKA